MRRCPSSAETASAVADALCGVRPTRPPHELPPPGMRDAAALEDERALRASAAELGEAGFTWVLLHRDRAETPERAHALLERALGPPTIARGDALAWKIAPPP